LTTCTDQLLQEVILAGVPQRIVSLVPSITELLFDLGLEERVVGVTKFCVHPNGWRKSKVIVGGTKTLSVETIARLNPDLIIAAKEENEWDQIEVISAFSPVWVSNVITVEDAFDLIKSLGAVCGVVERARELSGVIESHFQSLYHAAWGEVVYVIWNKPLMCAGRDTYINSLLRWLGYKNLAEGIEGSRYPEVTMDQLVNLKPEKIFLSSEPYPFKNEHLQYFQRHLPDTVVQLVDGEMFSWYGSRMLTLRLP